MTGFAIICDARAGHKLGIEVLALVDRSKSRRYWWTSDEPGIAIRYRSEHAAGFAAKRLRRNNARVVPFSKAARMLREQSNSISFHEAEMDFHEAMSSAESGWDDHKAWSTGL